MNGKQAKKLRRRIYRDYSHELREYDYDVNKKSVRTGAIINSFWSLRKTYQLCKKEYYSYVV